MLESYTAGAQRTLDRARYRARRRGAESVEPLDLLAALVDEEESRAAALLKESGLPPGRIYALLDTSPLAPETGDLDASSYEDDLGFSPESRSALGDAALGPDLSTGASGGDRAPARRPDRRDPFR
ncbi:MAG: Clp protease N-terminal domain-containing protein [Isosphaeraceae bacterium]